MWGPRNPAAIRVRPNLDLVTSNETPLAAARLYLAGRQSRDRVSAIGSRRRMLPTTSSSSIARRRFSSTMNQCARRRPGSSFPSPADSSLVGVRQVVKTVKNVNALLHHPVQIGVLPTFTTTRARICRDALGSPAGTTSVIASCAHPVGHAPERRAPSRPNDLPGRLRSRMRRRTISESSTGSWTVQRRERPILETVGS